MRFEPSRNRRPPDYLGRIPQTRLFILLMSLGLIIVLMNLAYQPQTVEELNRPLGHRIVSADQVACVSQTSSVDPNKQEFLDVVCPELLEPIQDDTYFRQEETEAWFHLLEVLQSATENALSAASAGEVDYVQLVEQPQVYRGRLVTVRGTSRRVETLRPAKNDIGLDRYHLITLRPLSGQIWPIRAYVLHIPDDFPMGIDISAEVAITGFFFKNWSYQWQGGMGLAPVLLAKNLTWLDRPVASDASGRPESLSAMQVTLVSAVVAGLLVGWAVWNTRTTMRRSTGSKSSSAKAEDVATSLQRLSDEVSEP